MSEIAGGSNGLANPAEANEGRDLTLEEAETVVGEVELELAAIDRALGRIEARIYGACTICGGMISPEVLSSQPMAERCDEHRGLAESPQLFPG